MFDERQTQFSHTVEGTWGEFVTPAGRVAYLMTKARLGRAGTDFERRLTSQLRPVREVLDPKKLDFNQLLQRDLDDHRVATQLLPYLLESSQNGPAFFPPIMAVLLPFNADLPSSTFDNNKSRQRVHDSGVIMDAVSHGSDYQEQRMVNSDGEYHSIKLGRLSWSNEKAKLVVLDGQHRAMALIAIDRTVNGTWRNGSGEKYRHFYEHEITRLLSDKRIRLDDIEVPVTVCWFPELSDGVTPHHAARKLFVDVNKEARKPSESRMILLSDASLMDTFARSLLSEIRSSENVIPLCAVEYDNPDSGKIGRWSAFTSISVLRDAVEYTAFSPAKYLDDMSAKIGGRKPLAEMDERMRSSLSVQDDRVGDLSFEAGSTEHLSDRFTQEWGKHIVRLMGSVTPYKEHVEALTDVRDQWIADSAMSGLAYDSLFVGAGMYWTLRSSDDYYNECVRDANRKNEQKPARPAVLTAWDIINAKRDEFEQKRAECLSMNRSQSNLTYDVMNTHACQLGLVMAFSVLRDRLEVVADDLCSVMISRINHALSASPDLLTRHIECPINRIGKMTSASAVYFRALWLEVIGLDEGLISESRKAYVDYLIKEQERSLRMSHPSWSKAELRSNARDIELREVGNALEKWFGVNAESFNAWSSRHYA